MSVPPLPLLLLRLPICNVSANGSICNDINIGVYWITASNCPFPQNWPILQFLHKMKWKPKPRWPSPVKYIYYFQAKRILRKNIFKTLNIFLKETVNVMSGGSLETCHCKISRKNRCMIRSNFLGKKKHLDVKSTKHALSYCSSYSFNFSSP